MLSTTGHVLQTSLKAIFATTPQHLPAAVGGDLVGFLGLEILGLLLSGRGHRRQHNNGQKLQQNSRYCQC